MEHNIIENFLELVDIESVTFTDKYENTTDIAVEDEESFILADGWVSHNSAISAFREFIYTDADHDGSSIAGLLMNFFGRYWPELFDQGRICRVMTPLVVAQKGTEKYSFYTDGEFEEWTKKTRDLKKWDIGYKKGLASLEDDDYKDIIQSPKLFSIEGGKELKLTLDTWFASDAGPRKLGLPNAP